MMYGVIKNPYIRTVTLSIVIILCLVLIIPLSISCSGTDATSSNHFLELLSLVPVIELGEDVPTYYTLLDYASVFQDTGFTFSSPEELIDKITTKDFCSNVIGYGSHITGFGLDLRRSTIRKKYLGYDATNIDAEIQFGIPPADVVIAIGRFDPQATLNALSNQDEWPSWAVDKYAMEEYNGVTIHSWGDGLAAHLTTRMCSPHLDNLGRARPLAVTDKYLFYAYSVEVIKLLIDTNHNKSSTLADLPEYASIANCLADLHTYSAVIGPSSIANLPSEQNGNEIGGPLLKKYLTFGTGLGQDEKGSYLAVVLYHENDANAEANVSLVRQRTEYAFPLITNKPLDSLVTDMQIDVEGNILIAKIYTVSPSSLWVQWFYFPDSWLFHE
jgi:hypothetical protein